jgi:uncharacterized membrane-anchored protein
MQHDPHRIRLDASRELHARPFPILSATCRLVHICVRVSPKSRDEVRAWLKERIKDFPEDFQGHWERPGADSWIRVERHTEFVRNHASGTERSSIYGSCRLSMA